MAFVKLADNYTDLIGKFAVALLAEGVDRNDISQFSRTEERGVALLAEGVDRNFLAIHGLDDAGVALLAEGVDRNALPCTTARTISCRPPRGGRG